ncbi:MAG: ThuA domain-containing protein, partial [Verrucomicrobia bacterium]|nr:ThuA domain-containing protein [Verrucomicrobiota bacterium]
MNQRFKAIGLTILLSASLAGTLFAQAPAPAKHMAYLALATSAQDGNPELPPWKATGVYADRKLQARFSKLGFTEALGTYAPDLTLDYLKQFNVVILLGGEGGDASQDRFTDLIKEKRQLLLKYVEEGGGLLVLRSPGWQFGKDIEDLNAWLKPCNIEILSEQVIDEDSCYMSSGGNRVFWTDNFSDHPVARDVKGVFYPDTLPVYPSYTDFTSPVKAGNEWKVIVSGRKSAKSLATPKGKAGAPPLPGLYSNAPPLLATRDYGKGRIAVWPIATTIVWQDCYHMLWERGAFMEGTVQRMQGDGAKLMENLMSYLAEPSKGMFGGYVPKKKETPPESGFAQINWDAINPKGTSIPLCFVGLIGAQTALSCGQGKPEAFIQAAKQAGYQFIAFTEDLAKLKPDSFAKLKEICSKNSDQTFKAYPGFTYLDESGNIWASFSENLRWPDKEWWSTNFPGRITVNNTLSRGCAWPPVIMIKPNASPEKPWFQGNFKVISVFTYENGKLVDDALDVYLRLQTERFQLAPVTVHFVKTPDAVKQARSIGYQTYIRWFDDNVVDAISSLWAMYKGNYVWFRSSFVSEGPLIEDLQIINFGNTDLAIPDNDRFRVHIRTASPVGLKETTILDGDAKRPWRRFLPAGVKEFEQTIDGFHDQEHNLIVTAMDINGKKAIGSVGWTQVQENSFPRCSDNFNTMPRGKWWPAPKEMQLPTGI